MNGQWIARSIFVGALLMAACRKGEPPPPAGQLVTLPSGRQIRSLSIRQVNLGMGKSALMLSYVSAAKSADDIGLITSEVDDIWPEFLKEVNKSGFDSAIVSANCAPSGALFSRNWIYNVSYARDQQGRWNRLVRK